MGAHAGRLGAQIVSRGKGHSAVSKAAYNARATLENERLGTRDDYSRKHSDCLFSGIYAPSKSPEWTRDREQLWNHVEAFEKRKDAQLARELLIDLPHELTAEQCRWFMQDFIKENFTRNGMVADLAIHAPHSHSDERNIHAHLLIVLRKLDGTEFAANKTRQTYAENVAELDGWKRSLEQHANKALTRHGHEARWDLRSNAERGVDREPEIHLGKAAAALERQGIETAPGNVNRQIRERNRDREAANENDRAEWVREQIAEAQVSTLPELEAMQRDRDRAAAEARDELEAENMPQHREARPLFDPLDLQAERNERLAREAQERGDDSASRARKAMEDLARIDPVGTARNFGYYVSDRLKTRQTMAEDYARTMRGGISAEQAKQAAENAAAWKKMEDDLQREADAAFRLTPEPQRTQEPDARSADPSPAPAREAASPDPAPVHLVAQSRDQVDDMAAYADRQKAAFEETQRMRTALEAAEAQRKQVIDRAAEAVARAVAVLNAASVQEAPLQPAREPQPIAGPILQPEPERTPQAPENDVSAILRQLDDRFRYLPPTPVQEAAPQPAREPEQQPTPERTQAPEPPAQAPEIARPSLFQTLTVGFWNWLQPAPQPAPQPDRAADRDDHHAGDDRQAGHVNTPAPVPARTPAPEPAPAPRQEQPRPAERLGRSIAEQWLAEDRAELARERAAETAQQRAERERREAEQSRGRGDGSHDRTRQRHSLLWELFHPFHDHRRRDHHKPP